MGSGRFDDPAGEFRVLYTTVQRRTAFLETRAHFRPSLDALAALDAIENADEPLPSPKVPADWYRARAVGRLRLKARQRWLDLRSLETREALRHEHGYAGLVYSSRLYAALTCLAIFEDAIFDPVGIAEPILPDDPDLVSVARSFGLNV